MEEILIVINKKRLSGLDYHLYITLPQSSLLAELGFIQLSI